MAFTTVSAGDVMASKYATVITEYKTALHERQDALGRSQTAFSSTLRRSDRVEDFFDKIRPAIEALISGGRQFVKTSDLSDWANFGAVLSAAGHPGGWVNITKPKEVASYRAAFNQLADVFAQLKIHKYGFSLGDPEYPATRFAQGTVEFGTGEDATDQSVALAEAWGVDDSTFSGSVPGYSGTNNPLGPPWNASAQIAAASGALEFDFTGFSAAVHGSFKRLVVPGIAECASLTGSQDFTIGGTGFSVSGASDEDEQDVVIDTGPALGSTYDLSLSRDGTPANWPFDPNTTGGSAGCHIEDPAVLYMDVTNALTYG